MTTPTPRTDAAYTQLQSDVEWIDFARELERDLAAAQEARNALHTQFVEMRRRWQLRDLYATQLEERLDEAQEARQAAEALAAQNAKDAERYRWLRAHSFVVRHAGDSEIHYGSGYQQTAPETLDAALDAYRAAAIRRGDEAR